MLNQFIAGTPMTQVLADVDSFVNQVSTNRAAMGECMWLCGEDMPQASNGVTLHRVFGARLPFAGGREPRAPTQSSSQADQVSTSGIENRVPDAPLRAHARPRCGGHRGPQ